MVAVLKNRKKVLNQVLRFLVCLLLCFLLLFNYSLKPAVNAAATTVAVCGVIAIATALTALGVGVAGATSNSDYNQWCQGLWNSCPCKDSVNAAINSASGGVQYFFDVQFMDWMKSTVTSDDNFTDGGASLYSGVVNTQSLSVTVPAKTDTSGTVTVPSYTLPTFSLPDGISHTTSFSKAEDFLSFMGLSGKKVNLQYSKISFPSTATNWMILSVKYAPVLNYTPTYSGGALDKDFLLSSPSGDYTYKFPASFGSYYKAFTLSYNSTLIKSTSAYLPAFCVGQGYNESASEIPIIMYSYQDNGLNYIAYLSHNIYGSGQSAYVTVSTTDSVQVPSAPVGVVPDTNVYAKDMSVMNHTLQEILDKMKQYGMTTSDGKVTTNVPSTAKEASDVRTRTQADVLGGTIATAADTTADTTTNEGKDTSFPRDTDIPNLDLPTMLTKKFPFSIPFDLYNTFTGFKADPVAPKWTIPIVNERLGIHEGLTIDFGAYGMDKLALLCRWFVGAFFVLSLILITRKLIGAGG